MSLRETRVGYTQSAPGRTSAIGPTRPHTQPENLLLHQLEATGAPCTHQGPAPEVLSNYTPEGLHVVQTCHRPQCTPRPCTLEHSVHGLDAQVCRQACVKTGHRCTNEDKHVYPCGLIACLMTLMGYRIFRNAGNLEIDEEPCMTYPVSKSKDKGKPLTPRMTERRG